jgi:hypothetical protein
VRCSRCVLLLALIPFHLDTFDSPFHTAHPVPAARFCARVLLFGFAHPKEGWRSAESRRVLARHPWACT